MRVRGSERRRDLPARFQGLRHAPLFRRSKAAKTTRRDPRWTSAGVPFPAGCSELPESASHGAGFLSEAADGDCSFEILSFLHVGIGGQTFNATDRTTTRRETDLSARALCQEPPGRAVPYEMGTS